MFKKISALMIMVFFVVSMIPLALAEDGSVKQHGKEVVESDHMKDTRDRALAAQASFGDVKAKIMNNKAQVAKCLVNGGTSNCASLLAEDINNRKDYLLDAVDRIEVVLDSLEDKAQHISDVTERDEMVNHLEDERTKLHDLKSKIETVSDRDGLKNLRDEFKVLYENVKDVISQYKVNTRLGMMHGINQKLINLNARLGHIADNLEAKGVTLGEDYPAKYDNLQKSISEAEERLDLARERYQHAVELKNSGASKAEVQGAISEAKEYLKQVNERVRAARNHVQDIVQAFRTRAGNDQLSTAIEETAE